MPDNERGVDQFTRELLALLQKGGEVQPREPTFKEKWENAHSRVATFIDSHIDHSGPYLKYALRVLMRVPMFFFVHHWLILTPYSEYTLLNVPLRALVAFGALSLIGCIGLRMHSLLLVYSSFVIHLIAAWFIEYSYWLIQNESKGACMTRSPLFVNVEDSWWTVIVLSNLVQICYITFMDYRYEISDQNKLNLKWCIFAYLFLHNLCSLGYGLFILTPIYYYFYKIAILLALWLDCMLLVGPAENFTANQEQNPQQVNPQAANIQNLLRDKWLFRDVCAIFAIVYFCSCLLIDIYLFGSHHVFTGQFLNIFIGRWTTSFIILSGICTLMGFISNCAVAASRFLVIGSIDINEVFNVNVGARAYSGTMTLCFQAGILYDVFDEKPEAMSFVMVLGLFIIVCQLWDLSRQQFLFLLNSGDGNKIFSYIRVATFLIAIVIFPTYVAYHLAPVYNYDLWPFFHVTGIALLLSSSIISVVEFAFIGLSWHVDQRQRELETAIYYTRVCRSVVHIVCLGIGAYYRIVSPFFENNFTSSVLLSLIDFGVVAILIIKTEWREFQRQRELTRNMNRIPDASPEEIDSNTDNCYVCFASVETGKRLSCRHIVHKECLLRWIQVQPKCPYCSAIIN